MTEAAFSAAYFIAVTAFIIREWIKHKMFKRKIGIKIRAIVNGVFMAEQGKRGRE